MLDIKEKLIQLKNLSQFFVDVSKNAQKKLMKCKDFNLFHILQAWKL